MARFGRFVPSDRTANANPEIPGLFFGRVLKRGGELENIRDEEGSTKDMVHALTMMELNRKFRQKKNKGGKREDRLRGLFGGK